MTETISLSEFKLLRDYIAEHSGITLGADKNYLIEARLSGILAESGCADFTALHGRCVSESGTQLRDRLIDAMTTNETLWFRDSHPFKILQEKLIPPLVAEMRAGTRSKIRIWSAASSTGQEPYSIAIAARELCRTESGLRPENIEIVATDISPTVLAQAKTGRYAEAEILRGMPADLGQRYFRHDGDFWTIDEEIRRMVRFEQFNLQRSPAPLGRFDIVFCRYVTIYFTDAMKSKVYDGIAQALTPNGALIISAVEQMGTLSSHFQSHEHLGGTYYRRRF